MTKRRIADLIFTTLLGAVFLYVAVTAQQWPLGARLLPTGVGVVMVVLILAQLAITLRKVVREGADAVEKPVWPDVAPEVARSRAIKTILAVVMITLSVWLFGFPIGGPLALAVQLLVIVRERLVVSLSIVASSVVVLWALSELLNIPFPEPVLPFLSNPF